MKNKIKCGIALIIGLWIGCYQDASTNGAEASPLRLSLTSDKVEYKASECPKLMLKIENKSDKDVVLLWGGVFGVFKLASLINPADSSFKCDSRVDSIEQLPLLPADTLFHGGSIELLSNDSEVGRILPKSVGNLVLRAYCIAKVDELVIRICSQDLPIKIVL